VDTEARSRTRDIARTAIRTELAQVAFDLFRQEGFDKVTLDDLAKAAGVSRSTFLRYFGSKEEAVLSVLDTPGAELAHELRARPADEDDWTALRRALDRVVEYFECNRADGVALRLLVQETPALCARSLEKQNGWRPIVARALIERPGSQTTPLTAQVRAAAALDCLNVALDHWAASDDRTSLANLTDEAFAAFTPR
jgi:AcrR family transcriptional regulator